MCMENINVCSLHWSRLKCLLHDILKPDHFLMALLLLCIDEMKITRYLACSTHNEMRQSVKIKRGDAVALLWWLSVAAFVGDKGIDASDVPRHILLGFVLFCYNNHPYVLHTAGMVTETFFCISTIGSVLPTSKAKYPYLCSICCV